MYPRLLGYILLLLAIVLIDVAFVTSLPFGLHHLHLVVIAIIFIYLLGDIRQAAWCAMGAGFLLEAFSFAGFGWHMFSLLAALSVATLLFQKVMTNRSLYSISVVTAAAILSCDLVLLAGGYVSADVPIVSWGSALGGEAVGLLYNIALALAVFYVSNSVTRQLHPGFLSGRSRAL